MWLVDKIRSCKNLLMEFLPHLHPLETVGMIADHIEPLTVDTVLYNSKGEPKMNPETADMVTFLADLMGFTMLGITSAYTGGRWYCWQSYWFWVFAVWIGVCHDLVKRAKCKVEAWYHARIIEAQNKGRTTDDGITEAPYPSSTNWINSVVATMWLNYRDLASHIFLVEVWPKLQAQAKRHTGKLGNINLNFYQLDIGDRAPTVDSVKTSSDPDSDEIILDVEAAYRGNAVASGSVDINRLQIPLTLSKIFVSNIKLRIILKGIVDKIPMISGVQLFLLEPPKIDWSSEFAAKVTEIKLIKSAIRDFVTKLIEQAFVYPNRWSHLIEVPEPLAEKLRENYFQVNQPSVVKAFGGPPRDGVLEVTVVKAENIKPTEMTYEHLKESENVNPLRPDKFAFSELLPKKTTASAYCQVVIGHEVKQSEVVPKTRNPEWNFRAFFPIEYHEGQKVKIEIYDPRAVDDLTPYNSSIMDPACTGSCWQDMKAIWDVHAAGIKSNRKGVLENWYNLQNGPGRVYLRFEVFEVTETIPRQPDQLDQAGQQHKKVPGLLCVFVGTVEAEFKCKVQAFLTLETRGDKQEHNTPEPSFKKSAQRHRLYINKFFVIDDIYSNYNKLMIKIWCTKRRECIGRTEYKVKQLLHKDYLEKKPFHFNVFSRVLGAASDAPAPPEQPKPAPKPNTVPWTLSDDDLQITRMNNPENNLAPIRAEIQLTVYALDTNATKKDCINEECFI